MKRNVNSTLILPRKDVQISVTKVLSKRFGLNLFYLPYMTTSVEKEGDRTEEESGVEGEVEVLPGKVEEVPSEGKKVSGEGGKVTGKGGFVEEKGNRPGVSVPRVDEVLGWGQWELRTPLDPGHPGT